MKILTYEAAMRSLHEQSCCNVVYLPSFYLLSCCWKSVRYLGKGSTQQFCCYFAEKKNQMKKFLKVGHLWIACTGMFSSSAPVVQLALSTPCLELLHQTPTFIFCFFWKIFVSTPQKVFCRYDREEGEMRIFFFVLMKP